VIDQRLREELLAMMRRDDEVRARLAADGSLYQGYHREMEAVHRSHATRLHEIFDERDRWPGRSEVGDDGAAALWRLVQHAIGDPPLLRNFLDHLNRLAGTVDDRPTERAMLEDRVRVFEGRPQLYGTQLDWDGDGRLDVAVGVEDPLHVDQRRAAVGLPPLQDTLAAKRSGTSEPLDKPPADPERHRLQYERWLREVGWR
jgi:hypothetical protein